MNTLPRFKDIKGQKFGYLTVLEPAGISVHREKLWKCLCDCGNEAVAKGSSLRRGATQSCGHIKEEQAKRHQRNRFLSSILGNMRDRCYNKKNQAYKNYGGRGITVCEEWMTSNREVFCDWAWSSGYSPGLSIDRIDNSGNYEPGNCRWVTSKEQARNTRSNRIIQISDSVSLTLGEACEKYAVISPSGVRTRMCQGWSDLEALLLPRMSNTRKYKSDAATDATITTL